MAESGSFLCPSPTQHRGCYRRPSHLRTRCRHRRRHRRRRWCSRSFRSLIIRPPQAQLFLKSTSQPPLLVAVKPCLFSLFTPTLISLQNYNSLRKTPCLSNRVTFKRESLPLAAKPSSSRRKFVLSGSPPPIPVVRTAPHFLFISDPNPSCWKSGPWPLRSTHFHGL